MTTIKNLTGTKAVNISTDATGTVNAMYVDVYNGQEQVIESKQYKRKSTAVKWANKMLGLQQPKGCEKSHPIKQLKL